MLPEALTDEQDRTATELGLHMFGSLIQRAVQLLSGQDEGVTWQIVSKAVVTGSVALARNTRLPVDEFVELVRAEYTRQEALPIPHRVLPRPR